MGFLPACEVCAIDGTVRGHARELGVERLVTLPPVKRAQTKRGKSVCGLEKRNALSHRRSFGFAHHWHRKDGHVRRHAHVLRIAADGAI